ncbi:MAG: hypothetical protein J6S28_07050 [Clostridia bacterium]|nr:hypothetical protein [Clostridia bacterium]MBO7296446.1 hypothetical protein [Clostridia bacterium]
MKRTSTKKASAVQKTRRLTVSALLCALGAGMLCMGRLFDGSLDLSMAALASLITVWAAEELDGSYPWLIWLVTSLLSLLLMPFNTAAWEYLLFAGLYPMLRVLLEKIPRVPRFFVKLTLFNGVIALGVLVLWKLLFPWAQSYPAALGAFLGGQGAHPGYSLAVFITANGAFVLYDFVIGRSITAYRVNFRNRFKFLQMK